MYSGVFRYIPVYSGIFRCIPVFSRTGKDPLCRLYMYSIRLRLVGYERRRGGIFPYPKHGQRVTDCIPRVNSSWGYNNT